MRRHIKKMRSMPVLSPFFLVRDRLMLFFNLFSLKSKIKNYFFLWKLKIDDEKKKKIIRSHINKLPDGLFDKNVENQDFIVSLTSYGNRVTDSLPYALFSLVTQTIKPSKIVVYLDEKEWNDANLPLLLVKLKKIGVDFRYCKNILSYKKLLPALKDFPNNPIIVVDDDFYYNKDLIKWFIKGYNKSDKKTVLGLWGCIPRQENGKYILYNEWKDIKYITDETEISLFGGYGSCYPPHIFDDEIFKEDIFMKLCPTADDIWFWLMEKRLGISVQLIDNSGYGSHTPVNRICEYNLNQPNTLTKENVVEGKNNSQLMSLLSYYQI